jgi:hypothetical protein
MIEQVKPMIGDIWEIRKGTLRFHTGRINDIDAVSVWWASLGSRGFAKIDHLTELHTRNGLTGQALWETMDYRYWPEWMRDKAQKHGNSGGIVERLDHTGKWLRVISFVPDRVHRLIDEPREQPETVEIPSEWSTYNINRKVRFMVDDEWKEMQMWEFFMEYGPRFKSHFGGSPIDTLILIESNQINVYPVPESEQPATCPTCNKVPEVCECEVVHYELECERVGLCSPEQGNRHISTSLRWEFVTCPKCIKKREELSDKPDVTGDTMCLKCDEVLRDCSCDEPRKKQPEIDEAINPECELCNGTGFHGDNGPGIEGNSEWNPCECNKTSEKCRRTFQQDCHVCDDLTCGDNTVRYTLTCPTCNKVPVVAAFEEEL